MFLSCVFGLRVTRGHLHQKKPYNRVVPGKKLQLFLIVLLFLATRLINLTSLPIFNDEAIYLHWGSFFLRHLNSPQNLIAIDGKQTAVPLLYGSVQFLPLHTLVAGRLATVFFSL